MNTKRQWLTRILTGGLIGLAVLILLGGSFNSIAAGGLITTGIRPPFRLVSSELEGLTGSAPLAAAIQFILYFALGAAAGVATLPFSDDSKGVLGRSLAHFAVTAGLLGLTCGLCGWAWNLPSLLVELALLALVYLLIWLGRWVGWYAEVAAIRKKLGLAPNPSPMKWKETLPYLFFALLMCDLLPALLRLLDPVDVPIFTGLLLPFLLLPVAGFFSGLSLGRRHGLCLLYPAACFLLYLPVVLFLYNASALFHCLIVGIAALLGDLAGAALCRVGKPASKEVP